jgi:hypothetical protein
MRFGSMLLMPLDAAQSLLTFRKFDTRRKSGDFAEL